MRLSALFIMLFLGFSSFCQKNQLCFSFDDLPVVNYGMKDSCFQKNLMNKLINSLKKNEIPAIGFVNEKKLYNENALNLLQLELLKSWIDSGLELGNHTYSHPDYNSVSFQNFTADIMKGESISKKLLTDKGKSIRYFRHPFLHVGNSMEKADSLSDFLLEHDYKLAPVTIDNDDYLFALAYKRALDKQDSILMATIGHDYVNYMEKKIKYFEKQAYELFGRNMKHILLLHASLINSDYMDSLAIMYKRNNYQFVNMDKALEDGLYLTEITVYGNWGISWIDRWALSMGKKGDFFKDDPPTPGYIKKMAN